MTNEIVVLDGVPCEYLDVFKQIDTHSQNDMILSHMMSGQRIDGMTSLRLYGCNRLPARILELTKSGHIIDNEWASVNGKRYKRYFIRGAK